jgi:hypothetical protein
MAQILNYSGLSCTDGQLYLLYAVNPPSPLELFKAYSGTNGHYFQVLTTAIEEQDTSGIEISPYSTYVGCYTTPGYNRIYYYRANECNSGPRQNVIVSSYIPNLHILDWVVRDTANPTICFEIVAPTLTVSGNPITKTFANCSDCSVGYSTQPFTATTGGFLTSQEPCQVSDDGLLFTWGNNASPAVGEPLFLDADTVQPLSGASLYYSTNWTSPPKSFQINNSGTIQSLTDCECYFTVVVNEDTGITTPQEVEACVSNMEFIVQYRPSESPCKSGHGCNAAAFFLTGNGIRITGGTIANQAVWLNNYGGPYDKLNYPPGIFSGPDRYNKLTADTATAAAIAATSDDGFIRFSLDCAIKQIYPGNYGFGRNKCHTDVTWITLILNGQKIYSGCPNGNFLTINPCTGKVISNTS